MGWMYSDPKKGQSSWLLLSCHAIQIAELHLKLLAVIPTCLYVPIQEFGKCLITNGFTRSQHSTRSKAFSPPFPPFPPGYPNE